MNDFSERTQFLERLYRLIWDGKYEIVIFFTHILLLREL